MADKKQLEHYLEMNGGEPVWLQRHLFRQHSKWVLYPNMEIEKTGYDTDKKERVKYIAKLTGSDREYCIKLEEFNYVSIPKSLVVIDIDEEELADNERALLEIQKRLEEDFISFKLYSTGGKGFHFHIEFPQLKEDMSNITRTQIKKSIIAKYGKGFKVDLLKASGKTLIGLEDCFHRNGERKKLLVYEYHPDDYPPNMIPSDCFPTKAIKKKFIQAMSSFDMKCIDFLQTEKIPEGFRDNVLFSLISHWKFRFNREELIKRVKEFVEKHDNFLSEQTIIAKIDNALSSEQRTGCQYNKLLLEGLGKSDICKRCKEEENDAELGGKD